MQGCTATRRLLTPSINTVFSKHETHFSQLVSNWILTSCQPLRVTSGQSNCHKQTHASKPLIYIYKPFLKSVHKTYPYTNTKQNMHKHTKFRRVSPFNIPPAKRAHKAWTRWYRRPFRLSFWNCPSAALNPLPC